MTSPSRLVGGVAILIGGMVIGVGSTCRANTMVSDGTKVPLRLLQRISSETSKVGEIVNLEVAEDVQVDGIVVLRQGTPAKGTIVEAIPKRRMGRAGKLVFAMTETKTADGRTLRLRSASVNEGESHVTGVAVTTTVVAFLVPVAAPFALLRHGEEIGAPEGARYDAFVDGNHALSTTIAPHGTENTVADLLPGRGAASGAESLSNRDIINMAKAGMTDDLMVMKIRTSHATFDTSVDRLIELKAAGISDRVIAAILASPPRPILVAAEPRPALPSTPSSASILDGASPDRVRALFGQPSYTSTDPDGVIRWAYSRPDGEFNVFFYQGKASLDRPK